MMPGETEEPNSNEGKIETTETLAEVRQKADSYLESWKRAQADFINYKRRTEQEKQEMGKYANAQLILFILPVLDDFERALGTTPPDAAKPEWVEGMKLIASKLRAILESQGLTPIEAVGKPFDPAVHEAMMPGKGKEGIVVTELRRGYRLHERVLRPSQVVVGNGEEENT
ncbi:MAG: nucleotide exchange factor GrpE [Dehalococcoidia bacterium]|nr:nucleotide exchange factor GrpE [Dehalococcoidia bacterium]